MRLFGWFRPIDPSEKWRVAQRIVDQRHDFDDLAICRNCCKTREQLIREYVERKGENE